LSPSPRRPAPFPSPVGQSADLCDPGEREIQPQPTHGLSREVARRNKLTALDEQLWDMGVGDWQFERLTNVGQALIAANMLDLPTAPEDLSTMIKRVVGGPRVQSAKCQPLAVPAQVSVTLEGRNRDVNDEKGDALRLPVGVGDLRDGRRIVSRHEIVVSRASRRGFRCAEEAPSEVGKVENSMTLYIG
jgi:hypothetical protein